MDIIKKLIWHGLESIKVVIHVSARYREAYQICFKTKLLQAVIKEMCSDQIASEVTFRIDS